jgi:Cu(I)/Ag(I) efflux system membrane protein CusA/SilA
MIEKVIAASLHNRFLMVVGTILLVAIGIWAVRNTPLDAIPDLSDVQVIVFTEFPGQAPQVVEDQVTYPLTTAMLAVPYANVVQYLNYVSGRLPDGVTPTLGPDATGVGWVYEYALVDRTGQHDLAELRSIQDWYLRYPLQTVPGVAEVASVGGYVKQYQVQVDPNALVAYKIPLSKVRSAIMRSNRDVGGRLVEISETEYMVRGRGYIRSIEDIESIAVGVDERGTPIRIQDIARVQIGPELRRGIAELDGEGEVAAGVVIMRYGENALTTIRGVREKLEQLKAGLPDGVEIVPVYDRGSLIDRAVDNLSWTLILQFVLVTAICAVFLLHLGSALVAAPCNYKVSTRISCHSAVSQ